MMEPTKIRAGIVALFLFANVFAWYAVFWERNDKMLSVAFLDVGQGDSIFIETPEGKQVLIDAGAPGSALRSLSSVLPFYDRFLDVMIGTHPDLDHIGGFGQVLNRYMTGAFFVTPVESGKDVEKALDLALEDRSIQKIEAKVGTRIFLDEDVVLEILYPDHDLGNDIDTNNASIVARLTYGDVAFLFTGDLPESIEEYLAEKDPRALRADVLKAGHHGSRTSTGEALLLAAEPKIVVVSAGKDNRYGHPHKDVLDRLAEHGIKVLRTSELGTVVIKTDGETIFTK